MYTNPEKIKGIIAELDQIIDACIAFENIYEEYLQNVHPDYTDSARNMVHYLALRSFDIRPLQKRLGYLGLTRLAKAEPHVMASLHAARRLLSSLLGNNENAQEVGFISVKASQKIQRKRNKILFGNKSKQRRVRIMVTQPTDAAYDQSLIFKAMKAGMNTVRINCAHDGPDEWAAMIDHANNCMTSIGRKCKISMDLAGPKIRTGAIVPGPKVARLAPERNKRGVIINPALFAFIANSSVIPDEEDIYIPIPAEWLKQLKKDDVVTFKDTRGKSRKAFIIQCEKGIVWARCYDSAYIETGTTMTRNDDQESVEVGEISPVEQAIILKVDDELILNKDPIPGELAEYNKDGKLLKTAHISCISAEVFDCVGVGEPVFFDDGKIEGVIKLVEMDHLVIRIKRAKADGAKLKADKGINFPKSNLNISGLTEYDKQCLPFIVSHADVINMSFVNTTKDVHELMGEIEKIGPEIMPGVIFKIETQKAFENLPEILLTAMQTPSTGVMIARGDLAIECGWMEIGRIQEEILRLCTAAHIPTVWATQVLENLAKKGIPSRAEITDAVMAHRSDCVMLNKGPYIVHAISLMDNIMRNMHEYREKKESLLPKLPEGIWDRSRMV